MIRNAISIAMTLVAAAAGLPAEDYDDLARDQSETTSVDKAALGQRDRDARAARTSDLLRALIALPPGEDAPTAADGSPLVAESIDDAPDGALALAFLESRAGYHGAFAKAEQRALAALAEQAPRWRELAPRSARLARALDALRALYEGGPLAVDAAALAQRRELCRALHPLVGEGGDFAGSQLAKRLERRAIALASATP
jgi:hypothetical protein